MRALAFIGVGVCIGIGYSIHSNRKWVWNTYCSLGMEKLQEYLSNHD